MNAPSAPHFIYSLIFMMEEMINPSIVSIRVRKLLTALSINNLMVAYIATVTAALTEALL